MSGNGSGGGAALAGFIPLTFATPTIMPEPMGSIRDRFVLPAIDRVVKPREEG